MSHKVFMGKFMDINDSQGHMIETLNFAKFLCLQYIYLDITYALFFAFALFVVACHLENFTLFVNVLASLDQNNITFTLRVIVNFLQIFTSCSVCVKYRELK